MKSGIKSSEAAVGTLAGAAAMLPVVLGSLPKEQTWIAIVAFSAVACVYISWRSFLKLKGLGNGQ